MTTPVDVLLICPNYASNTLITDAIVPPVGLASLAAYLREHGISVGIIDGRALNFKPDDFREAIRRHSARIVGITVLSSYVKRAAAIAQSAKAVSPDITVIVGGAHISALPEETLKSITFFDIAVVGEGEQTLLELVTMLLQGRRDYHGIDGIWFREHGALCSTKPRALIKNLDALPYPAFDLLPLEKYRPSINWIRKRPFIVMYTVRGCPFSCAFCASHVNFGKTVRYRSAESVVREIEYYKQRYGIRQILFNDDLLVINSRHIHEFCDMLINRRTDIVWGCFSTVDAMTPDLARKMRRAGCFMIFFGIESGSEEILKRINKSYRSIQQAREVIQSVKDAGIIPVGSFIVGFPGETEKTVEQTIAFACELPLQYAMFSPLVPFPGSPIFLYAREQGILPDTITDWERFEACAKPFLLSCLTEKQLLRAVKRAYAKFYFRPGIIAGVLRDSLSWYKLRHNASALMRILGMVLKKQFKKNAFLQQRYE